MKNTRREMVRKWMMLRLETSLKGAVANDNQDIHSLCGKTANDNPSLAHFSGPELVACHDAVNECVDVQVVRTAMLVRKAEEVAKRFGVDLDEPVR